MLTEPLEQAIWRTIAYFDLGHFPLTKEEFWRFLWSETRSESGKAPASSEEELAAALALSPFLEEKYGYYFLRGQSAAVETRRRATVATDQKLAKARRAARLLRIVPFVRAVLVCNSVGREVAKPESDIDFFIITETKRLWIVRFFANILLRLFGLRTYGAHSRDQICLSFFVDRAHLDLSPWRVAPDDVHLAYWILQMVPVYDPENLYPEFIKANVWLKNCLPNALTVFKNTALPPPRMTLASLWRRAWENVWRGMYGDLVEDQARELQKMLLLRRVKNKLGEREHGVVVEPGILKLHEQDARASYRTAWLNKLSERQRYVV